MAREWIVRAWRQARRGVFGALALVTTTGCTHGSAKAPPGASQRAPFAGPLPDVEVQSLDGRPAKLRELTKGKVAVVDLWATWCSACRDVSARAAELASSAPPDKLVVVGVDEGEDVRDVASFFGSTKTEYPIYVDTAFELANDVGSETVPTLLIVDREGKVRAVTHKLDERAAHLVSELLRAEPPAGGATPAP